MRGQFIGNKDMKFVSKPWGYELWIVNNDKYCGKILFIKQGQCCSFHYHKIKDEVLYVQTGRIDFRYCDPSITEGIKKGNNYQEIGPGEAFHVEPGLIHQMTALEDTTILEFSTHHEDSDSHRLEQPDYWKKFTYPPNSNWAMNNDIKWPSLNHPKCDQEDCICKNNPDPITVSER